MKNFLALCFTLTLTTSAFAAANRYVSPSGDDHGNNDCSNQASPCATIQNAINKGSAGDIVLVAAGTYQSTVTTTISKSIVIQGDGAVLNYTGGISITASDVVIQGVQIQGGTNFGVTIKPGVSNTIIKNSVITGNTIGIVLAGSNTLIDSNIISSNNLGDPNYAGYGIYTQESQGGQISNAVISNNTFIDNDSTDIAINISDPAYAVNNISILNNKFTSSGRGIYLINAKDAVITGNDIINLTPANVGKTSMALGIWGGVEDLVVTDNVFRGGPGWGISIQKLVKVDNDNIQIHDNRIAGYTTAGMKVDVAPVSSQNYATCNWWGSASGPENSQYNPNGKGNSIDGPITNTDFQPWRKTPEGSCGNGPTPPDHDGFTGTWENRGLKQCISISSEDGEAMSFSKCGPFKCKKKEGVFSAYSNSGVPSVISIYGIIQYNDPGERLQELELLGSGKMSVREFFSYGERNPANHYRTDTYRKVSKCHWHPKWPFPPKPKPTPTPNPTPAPK